MSSRLHFSLVAGPIEATVQRQCLGVDGAGAVAVFEGIVRGLSRGRLVNHLDYEAHERLVGPVMQAILQGCAERRAVEAIRVVHATGCLRPGEVAVWIGVAAERRAAACDTCREVLEELKRRAPIWRREVYLDGTHEWSPTPDPL